MFKSARVKLTLWYLVLIWSVTWSMSGLFYLRATSVVRQQFERIEQRLDTIGRPPIPMMESQRLRLGRHITADDLEAAKRMLLMQLILINGVVGLVVVGAGYWLSGKTLKPIEEAMESQRRFVGDAAHELKTPITAIKTALEVSLMEKGWSKKARKVFNENLEDIESLEKLSESLLKLARVDEVGIEMEEVEVAEIVKRAVKLVQPLAEKKKNKILVKVDENVRVRGDREALMDVVVNLLNNALTYSEAGMGVEVRVERNKDKARIVVVDRGMGIEDADLEHVFERFYRSDKARTKKANNGYGLGLAVVKKIVEEHGGRVEIKSKVNRGTKVRVSLPSLVA